MYSAEGLLRRGVTPRAETGGRGGVAAHTPLLELGASWVESAIHGSGATRRGSGQWQPDHGASMFPARRCGVEQLLEDD